MAGPTRRRPRPTRAPKPAPHAGVTGRSGVRSGHRAGPGARFRSAAEGGPPRPNRRTSSRFFSDASPSGCAAIRLRIPARVNPGPRSPRAISDHMACTARPSTRQFDPFKKLVRPEQRHAITNATFSGRPRRAGTRCGSSSARRPSMASSKLTPPFLAALLHQSVGHVSRDNGGRDTIDERALLGMNLPPALREIQDRRFRSIIDHFVRIGLRHVLRRHEHDPAAVVHEGPSTCAPRS